MTAVTQAKGTEPSPRDGRATVEASGKMELLWVEQPPREPPLYTQAPGWGWWGGSSCGHQPGAEAQRDLRSSWSLVSYTASSCSAMCCWFYFYLFYLFIF